MWGSPHHGQQTSALSQFTPALAHHCPTLSTLQRWGSLAFGDYVDALQRQADQALAAASAAER